MKHERIAPACLFAMGFLLGSASCASAQGFLHARGHDLTDEQGHKVLLRGVGLGNYLLPEGYMWKFGDAGDRPRKIEKIVSDLIGPVKADQFWVEFRRNYITEADIQRIAEAGFNSVRPALNARRFLTEGDQPAYVDEGFELLENLVKACKKHNIYVILDMHGAPGGQTGANIDDSPNDQPELFTDPKFEKRLIDLWVKIAERYRDEPIIAGYDLLNEPLPERTGAAAKHKKELEPLYRRITAAIRKVDKRHAIILEGADWSNDWSVFSKPFDSNLVYQFHYYCWDNPNHLKEITQYLDYRRKFNAPVWVGETGERDNTIYWATTQYFEQNNIGWSFWPWKKLDAGNCPCSIKKPAGWDAITAYTRGQSKPSQEDAQKAFDELLQNVKFENCVFHTDVVNALFHRLPVKVEAENYGHEGVGKSYSVKDPDRKSQFYRRKEPVLIESEQEEGSGRWRPTHQSVRLSAGEWTAYTVNSLSAGSYRVTLRVKAVTTPATFLFAFNKQEQDFTLKDGDWMEIKLNPVEAVKGANRCQLRSKDQPILFDWINLE